MVSYDNSGAGRLRPPSGAATVTTPPPSRLNPAATRPAPTKTPSTASRLLKLALSGETAYNFISKYAKQLGLDYGDYEHANGVAQFAADTFLSPVGLASTIAAPVTGGASLGLKGAAGAAARVATRAGGELAVNAAANLGGKAVEAALPEDTPGWVRAGAMLVGAAAGGGAAARQIGIMAGTTASRAAARAELQSASQGIDSAFGVPYKYLPNLDDFSKVTDGFEQSQIGTDVVGKVLRAGNKLIGASPASSYEGRFGAITQAADNVKLRNDDLAQKLVARLFPNGQNAFETNGTLWKVGNGDWVPHQEVIGDLNAVSKYGLTPEQAAVRQTFRDVRSDLDTLLASRGITVPKVNLGKGMDYWPHYSTANIDGDFLRAADRGKTRLYKTVGEGLDNGVEYASPLDTLQAFAKNTLEEVRISDVNDEISKLGITLDRAALATKEGKIAALKVRAIDRRIEKVRAQIQQEELRNKMAIGQGRSEHKRLIKEHNELRKMQREYQRALKVSATAELPAPRRGTTPERKAALQQGRAEFADVRQQALEGGLPAKGSGDVLYRSIPQNIAHGQPGWDNAAHQIAANEFDGLGKYWGDKTTADFYADPNGSMVFGVEFPKGTANNADINGSFLNQHTIGRVVEAYVKRDGKLIPIKIPEGTSVSPTKSGPFGMEADQFVQGAKDYRKVMAAGKMPEEIAKPLGELRDEHRIMMDQAITGQGDVAYLQNLKNRADMLGTLIRQAGVRKSGNVPELYAKLAKLREKQTAVRQDWSNVRNRTWDRLPGSEFGKQFGDAPIPVALWRGKYYVPKGADYEHIAAKYDAITGSPKGSGIPSGLRGVEQAANLGRFTAATGDFAGAFTQGLPLLAHNPVAWGKMAATSVAAFFDPAVQARYIEKNWDGVSRMIQDGIPGGDIEMLRAIQHGQLGEYLFKNNAIAKATGVSSLVRRFQASYDTMLLVTRHELYDTLLPVWKGDRKGLAKEINYMTGGLDPRAIGVGPTRQALESMTFFAPRMLRSTLSLAASAMKPWTPEGELAARTLARLTAGMAGVTMMTNLGIAALNGEDDTQVQKRLDDMFNPLNGRKFLSVPIGEHYYGVGGQVRSITQLLAKAVTDPGSLTKQDALDNPLIRFAGGRLSPAANTALGIAELATHEDHNFLPFNTIDNFPDLAQMTLTSALPFAVQSAIQDGVDWKNPMTFANPMVTASSEFSGVRATQFTEKDILDKAAYDRYGLPYDDLTGDEQKVVDGLRPDAADTRKVLGDKNDRELRAEKVRLDDESNRALVTLQEHVQSGQMSRQQYRDARGEVLKNRAIKLEEARRAYDVNYGAADTDKRRLIDDYFQTFDKADYTGTGAQLDWDLWESLQSELNQKIEAGVYGPKERAQQILDERRRFDSPADNWFEDNAQVIRDAGYWETRDAAFTRVAQAAAKIDPNIRSATELDQAYQLAAATGDQKLALRLGAIVQAEENVAGKYKQVLRVKNPALDKALFENGHVTKRLTKG